MKVLITGGAGFVGSHLALEFAKNGDDVTCFDNLMRRGSELNLDILKNNNIKFIHGDIRNQEDFSKLDNKFDLFIEASAEPSVHAGNNSSPVFVIQNNLFGAINCLEFARKCCAKTIFLSSSRVYSIPALKKIPLKTEGKRFQHEMTANLLGITAKGITEDFPVNEFRSFYGTTKLAAEYFIQEYAKQYELEIISNRCGVLCGEGQWGKTDQGVFTLWVARHIYQGQLSYTGFGGQGHQVRDLLHPADLYQLIKKQISSNIKLAGQSYNVGGGHAFSVSLAQYTDLCQSITGKSIKIASVTETAGVDIPYYVTDNSLVEKTFNWRPTVSPKEIVEKITKWIETNQDFLKPLFGQ